LETLCRQYWYPIYAFLRRQGHAHHSAEDLTQGFFAHMLASDGIVQAAPERGRFRTFMLTSVRHFATSEWRRAHSAKRGGPNDPLPLNLCGAEERFAAELANPGPTPKEAFDHHWALDLIQQAVDGLRKEYVVAGHTELFTALLPHAFGEAAGETQAVAARRLGLNEHALTVALSRLRKRLRERLRSLVADTVAQPEETEDELRILLDAVRRQPSLA
jgi:RNA polymerase sigma-70 factor (ECF subfamily)